MPIPRSDQALYDTMARLGMSPEGPRPKERKKRDNEESRNQQALIRWWSTACKTFGVPEVMLFAVGNGGARSEVTGAIMKREGVRRGTSDLFLSVPRGGKAGCYIEMKTATGRTQPEQYEFMAHALAHGYEAKICWSFDEAAKVIERYLQL